VGLVGPERKGPRGGMMIIRNALYTEVAQGCSIGLYRQRATLHQGDHPTDFEPLELVECIGSGEGNGIDVVLVSQVMASVKCRLY